MDAVSLPKFLPQSAVRLHNVMCRDEAPLSVSHAGYGGEQAADSLPPTDMYPPRLKGDFDLNPEWRQSDKNAVRAGVLIPVLREKRSLSLIFTLRSPHLPVHAGQISFPGGRVDPGDDDEIAAALRESEEEIGLARDKVEVLGCLDPYLTRTGFLVTPVVGYIGTSFTAMAEVGEVAEIFHVPLDFFLDRGNCRIQEKDFAGMKRLSYAYTYQTRHIWGVTAGIIRAFTEYF